LSKPDIAKSRRCFKKAVLWLTLAAALLAAAILFRTPLLRGVADLWIVDQPLQPAGVIVVLGGGLQNRPFAAAELYHQKLAPRLLLLDSRPSPTAQLGLTPSDTQLTRQILSSNQVESADVFVAPDLVRNTYEESKAVAAWALAHGTRHVIIPTDLFHTRRVRWIFEKQLRPLGIQVSMAAVSNREFTRKDWWQHEEGLITFQNEILKYAYYRLKY